MVNSEEFSKSQEKFDRRFMVIESEIDNLRISHIKIESTLSRLEEHVSNIDNKLDNGLGESLKELKKTVDEFIPVVRDNNFWIHQIKIGIIWATFVAIVLGLITFSFKIYSIWHEK